MLYFDSSIKRNAHKNFTTMKTTIEILEPVSEKFNRIAISNILDKGDWENIYVLVNSYLKSQGLNAEVQGYPESPDPIMSNDKSGRTYINFVNLDCN